MTKVVQINFRHDDGTELSPQLQLVATALAPALATAVEAIGQIEDGEGAVLVDMLLTGMATVFTLAPLERGARRALVRRFSLALMHQNSIAHQREAMELRNASRH